MWEWTECDQYFPSQSFVMLTVDQLVGRSGGPLEKQKLDSHVYRKTSTLPLICQKNQSRVFSWRSTSVAFFRLGMVRCSEICGLIHTTHNSSIRSDEGLTLQTLALKLFFTRWPIFVVNYVDYIPNHPVILLNRRNTTVSSETCPIYSLVKYRFIKLACL